MSTYPMSIYKVPEMSCQHCVATITEAVKVIDPSATVNADVEAGKVSIESTAEPARLEEAMREAGYESEPVSA